jgi:hypothetical protein
MRRPVAVRTRMKNPVRPLLLLSVLAAACASQSHGAAIPPIKWKKTVIDAKFRAEGVAVTDVNRDGRPDILAGNFWYEAPGWKPREIRPPLEFNGATGYSNCFLCFAADVDGDQWPDQLVIGFPGDKAVWRRNPGDKANGHWDEFLITTSACNETPIFADLDGDKHMELVTPFREAQMAFYSPGGKPREGFAQTLVGEPTAAGTKRFSHGLGVGDLNGDKRPDILCTDGYWEAPKATRSLGWKFVPAKLGPACATMYTHDFDGDGDMDVFSSSAHQIGVWWWEQTKGDSGPEFKQHVIDETFSQSHSVVMADINGDKKPDFVTGKRWWAHGPNGDVNPGDPAMLYWFEFRREGKEVKWTRHQIDDDSGVGTQFVVTTVNRDRLPDVVVSNKKGVFLFEQERGRN